MASSPLFAAVWTAFISFLAGPVLYLLDISSSMNEEIFLALTAVVICGLIFFLSYKYVFSGSSDFYLAWFSLFAFTATVDLILAFNINGNISVMDWYLQQGEKYLFSAYGCAINFWDGTVHWALYLTMIYGILSPSSKSAFFRGVNLFWVGSIMFSLFAFLPGACIGEFSHDIKLSSFLNVPYAVIPLYFLNRVLRADVVEASTPASTASTPAPAPTPLANLFFILSFSASIIVAFVRFCAAAGSSWPLAKYWLEFYEPILEDNTRFFHMQAYVWFLYVVPFYVVSIYCLIYGSGKNSRVLSDFAAVIAGGVSQTQFSLLFSVFSSLTPKKYLFPGNGDEQTTYVAICGGLLAGVPLLFAVYCFQNPKIVGILPALEKKTK